MNKFYLHPDKRVGDRFGICIDTCHIFASNHDIRSKKNIDYVFGIIDRIVGINKIKLCHVNDSQNELGSNIDRHMNIGKGYIGKKSIVRIVKFMNNLKVPLVLETPTAYLDNDYILLKNIY